MEGFICGIYINQKTKPWRKLKEIMMVCVYFRKECPNWVTLVEKNLKTFNIIDHNVLPNIAIFSDACLTGSGATYDGHSYHLWWPFNWWSLECWRIKESHNYFRNERSFLCIKNLLQRYVRSFCSFKNWQHACYSLAQQTNNKN